ncbi:MAG: hypothetical protein RLZZ196_864 [Bacteroidota bacterium]
MNRIKYYISLLLLSILLTSCNSYSKRSEVVQFEYQGYGDSTLSVMYGKVFENINGDEKPLQKVQVSIANSRRSTFSDLYGNFNIGMETGKYNLLISKNGYQSLLLKNYEAISDRVSRIIIMLRLGEGIEIVDLPNNK